MKHMLINTMLAVLTCSCFSIHTYAQEKFEFEYIDNTQLEEVKNQLNARKGVQKKGIEYTSDDAYNAVQMTYFDTLTLDEYEGGSFKDYAETHSYGSRTEIKMSTQKMPKSAYVVTAFPDGTVNFDHFWSDYWSENEERDSVIRNNIEKTASKYTDGGKVYICQYDWIFIGVVCDENDIPKYVVCNDSHVNFDKRSEQTETDNKEIKELLDTFDKLYDSYDLKVYDDNEHQYVFDFDFFVDVDKAIHGTLPDDYVFEPHGLESMAKNTIKTIDGRAYRFSKNGVCTGLYTGWSNTKNGKRFFRRGELVTGKTKINGKEYEFDKKGYLK